MIVQSGAAEIPETVLTKNRRIRPHLAFIESGGGRDDLEGGTRLHHVDDRPVFHLLWPGLRAEVQIKIRPIGHCQDFPCLRPHQNNGGFLRRILRHGGVDFILDDILQTKIDGQMDLVAVARSALLPPVGYDLLSGPVVLDETITVLPVKVFTPSRLPRLGCRDDRSR